MKYKKVTYLSLIINFICILVIIFLDITLSNAYKKNKETVIEDNTQNNITIRCEKSSVSNSAMTNNHIYKLIIDHEQTLLDVQTYMSYTFYTDNAYNSVKERLDGICNDTYFENKMITCQVNEDIEESWLNGWAKLYRKHLIAGGYACYEE